MTDLDALSARLTALETVVGHLMTHFAVRSEDPLRWVATRRTLALHAVHDRPSAAWSAMSRFAVEDAIVGLFDQVQDVVADYADHARPPHQATPGPSRR
jgi:hypothetical protein